MKKGIDIFNPKLVFPGNPPEAAPNTTQPEQPIHPAAQESLQHPANSQQDWQFASPQDSESGAPLMGSTRGDDDDEQDANATTSLQRQQICGYCSKSFGRNRDYNKHVKTHKKPIKCEADKSCCVTKAENRDMERHYISAHPGYAVQRGIYRGRLQCSTPGCGKQFTRHDNLLKHRQQHR